MANHERRGKVSLARRSGFDLYVPTTASALALVLALTGVAYGQTPVDANEDASSDSALQQVVVTGRRKALESATERKKESESIIDSVVADEAGMLPDSSITEVLQRVSGVAIVRFGALGDPDHFSAEGSGIQVRGLSGVAGRLNGREIFSASGGRGLSWGDITPELMAAVDVYKASTADLIEGGTGGQIDLRTKMPFDFAEPAVQVSANASYGDLTRNTRPGGSLLLADRWETGVGEFGALLDVAYSQYTSNSDFFRMEPMYRTRIGTDDRFIPGGYDYGDQDFERTRRGAYLGLQWAPSESLLINQTVFFSKYQEENAGSGLFVTSKDLAVNPAGNNVFGANGGFISSDSVFLRDNGTFGPSSGAINAGGNMGVSKGSSKTLDSTTSFTWDLGQWGIQGAFQIVDSSSTRDNYDVFPGVPFPGTFGLDLTGTLPQVLVPDSARATFTDPASYEWQATMDHLERNDGDLRAGNLDFDYALPGEGLFRSVRFGARYADRTERDNNSGFNWTALGRGWNGQPQMHFSDARPGDVETRVFDNFFRGDARLPGNTMMPSLAMVSKFDVVGDHTAYGGLPVRPIGFRPFDLNTIDTTSTAVYGLVRFADEQGIAGGAISGNVGVRVARTSNDSAGFIGQTNESTFIRDGVQYTMPITVAPRSGSTKLTKVLPSINFQLQAAESLQVRLAYNVTMDQPGINALRANGSVSVTSNSVNGENLFDHFTTDSGNPLLRPVISHNSDLALEWYPTRSATAHLSLFHKSIDNWITYGSVVRPVPITYSVPTAQTVIELAEVNEYFNSPAAATVKGVELGGRMFFDRLPAPFDGLGLEANYTYIDSKNPGDRYLDIDGIAHHDAPVQGLSKNNFNITGMYEKGPFSVRLAYSWRSEYLMSTNANGTSGDYTYYSAPGSGQFIDISLPIYSDDYGTLDFGTTWRPTSHLSLSFEMNNLTNEIAKTLMGGYPGGEKYVRSWFISDRRASVSLRYN